MVKLNTKELREVMDEAKAWTLLTHYLKFDKSKYDTTLRCLTNTLNSLTAIDLTRVSMLPYGGNRDRFDEINRIVNDPKKARLLDGMKRATRNDHEMSWMIKSLRRWLARDRMLR